TLQGIDYGVRLLRLSANGDLDPNWSTATGPLVHYYVGGNGVSDLAVQADGKIVTVGGFANQDDGTFVAPAITRFTTAGALDKSFSGDGKIVWDIPDVRRNIVATGVRP